MVDHNEYLGQRGAPTETLFGFRIEDSFAFVSSRLFVSDCGMGAEARCRFSGVPATLLQVQETLWLDLNALVRVWPSVQSGLCASVGEDKAHAFLAAPITLRTLDEGALGDFLVEHQIGADNFTVVGEGAPLFPAQVALRVELSFPRGTLVVEYSADAYERAHSLKPFETMDMSDIVVSFRDTPVSLDPAPWNDAEALEVLIIASGSYRQNPAQLVLLLEQVFPNGDVAGGGEIPAGIKTTWGLALRLLGRFEESVEMLEEVLRLAKGVSEENEQEASYNLGYALLCSTARMQLPATGAPEAMESIRSYFAIEEKHRDTWSRCETLFARALAIRPDDITAASQLRVTRLLFSALEHNAGSPPAGGPSSRQAREAQAPPDVGELAKTIWWVLSIVVLVLFLIVGGMLWTSDSPRRATTSEEHNESIDEVEIPPSPSELRQQAVEQERIEGITALRQGDPFVAGLEPCPIDVPLPATVRAGQAIAPRLGRTPGVGELFGTEYFDATTRNYLMIHAAWAEVLPGGPGPIGPLEGTPAATPFPRNRNTFKVSVLVDSWVDPQFAPDGLRWTPGSIGARIVLWGRGERRFVCGAEATATNNPALQFVQAPIANGVGGFAVSDDPLNRARVDLIEQILRAGIPMLRLIPETEVSETPTL